MASMRELANHIIAVARNQNRPITNLQIQKVMFFALGFHIRHNNIDDLAIETYDIPFEKWKYGPVVESIYYTFNKYRDNPVPEEVSGTYNLEYSGWDNNITDLLDIDVFTLVTVSHDLPSWANFENDILNRNYVDSYTLPEIARDFSV